ncbi:beta-ketoacyl synthase N-terminal-like domain-containing protein [Phytomonospora endophytica]|uniref:Polyketide synthase PksN n=1 Tax=Phytomonospora endophytica TaxID=714109 RepID=A0A841G495_9ACTN|nr:polyketide synthase [Phytomonospora endophytica]MBB6039539.1 polyketide synthase PksN [Phytomonospora endophytica]GIG70503.1 polyketide synthase [Phytomonospora endophytica]
MQPDIADLVLNGLRDGSVSRETAVKILRKLNERVPVAVIGMGARAFDTDDYQEVWRTVREERSTIRRAPVVRGRQVAPVAPPGMCARPRQFAKGSYIDDIQRFDHDLFGFDADAGAHLFPQGRIALETAFRALEDAGLMGEYSRGHRTGVYVGFNYTKDQLQSYLGLAMKATHYAEPVSEMLGNWTSGMATRVALAFDLRGPAYTIDASCPSSMAAMISACEAVRRGSCDTALAGGLYLDLTPVRVYNSPGLFVAPTEGSVTKLFDRRNVGSFHGEYAGFVVVKRLDRAIEDGDAVHGVIHGWSHNNNGSEGKFDQAAPSGVARAMEDLIRSSGVEAEDVGLLIAEGYTHAMEEALETLGLSNGLREFTQKSQFCALTALTGNLGYLHSAIGVANLTVLLQALRDRKIPAVPHFDTPTDLMNLIDTPFYVPTETRDWEPSANGKRLGVVYCYGFGGSNTLLAVGPAPDPVEAPVGDGEDEHGELPYCVSATDADSFHAKITADLAFAEQAKDGDFAALCHTSSCRQYQHGRFRLAVAARDREGLVDALRAYLSDAPHPDNLWEGRDLTTRGRRASVPAGKRGVRELAAAFAQGATPEMTALFPPGARRMIRLPRYRMNRVRCWVDPVPLKLHQRARMILGMIAASRSKGRAS